MEHHVSVFGITPADALGWPSPARDVDVVELWSGVGGVAAAARNVGLVAVEFDISRSPTEDLTWLPGFRSAVQHVLSLRDGGLLVMAPVCSSFVWMNKVHTKRAAETGFAGDTSRPGVHLGNFMAQVAVFLWVLARHRGVRVVMENPPSSDIWKYTPVAEALRNEALVAAVAHRCAYDVETPFGDRYLKAYKFVSTSSCMSEVEKACTCPGKEHKALVRRDGPKVTGIQGNLTESQAYPKALGEALITAFFALPPPSGAMKASVATSRSAPPKRTTARSKSSAWPTSGTSSEDEAPPKRQRAVVRKAGAQSSQPPAWPMSSDSD